MFGTVRNRKPVILSFGLHKFVNYLSILLSTMVGGSHSRRRRYRLKNILLSCAYLFVTFFEDVFWGGGVSLDMFRE